MGGGYDLTDRAIREQEPPGQSVSKDKPPQVFIFHPAWWSINQNTTIPFHLAPSRASRLNFATRDSPLIPLQGEPCLE
jgi:hypothetical protein